MIETIKEWMWIWLPAILVIGGFALIFGLGVGWPALLMIVGGTALGVSLAPHSPV